MSQTKLETSAELTVDSVFPREVGLPEHYVDWAIDRSKVDSWQRLLQRLRRNAEIADIVPIQMRESVDPNLIPSSVKEIDMMHSNLREFDQNTVVKVWLTAHLLAWYDLHEATRRKLFNIQQVLEDVKLECEAFYRQFKLRLEPFYVKKYGNVKAPLPEGQKGPQSTLARDHLILERGSQAQTHYDRIRDRLWDIENVTISILQATESYREGGGLAPFEKRAREIITERTGKEVVTIERTA